MVTGLRRQSTGILHATRALAHVCTLTLALMADAAAAGVALLYHHVDTTTPAITSIDPSMFTRHLDIIEEEGFTVVSLDALIDPPPTDEDSGTFPKRVAITFDDAYTSIYETAFPLLRARGWPFTIFVATDFVRDSDPTYLSWNQLREMAAGGAHIANHTASHTHLIRYKPGETHKAWQQRVTAEIVTAGKELAKRGFSTRFFAYPYGEYNLELLGIVEDQGLIGFGQQSGAIGPHSNRTLLPRYPLAGIFTGESAFRDKLFSLPMPIAHPELEPQVDPARSVRPPLAMTFIDDSVDPSRLTCFGPGGLMTITRETPRTAIAIPEADLPVGRSRYNCTLPTSNRYHWFSQLWIRKQADGQWYPEP